VKNIADSFRQHYNGGSSAVNIDHGRKKRSPTPGFQQTYMAGSHYENIDSTGASTGMQTWTGGQSVVAENNGNQHSTINQNDMTASGMNQFQQNSQSQFNQGNSQQGSGFNQQQGNFQQETGFNQQQGHSQGSGFNQHYEPGAIYENNSCGPNGCVSSGVQVADGLPQGFLKLKTESGFKCGGWYVFAQICRSNNECCEEQIVNGANGFSGGDTIQTKLNICTNFITSSNPNELTVKLEGWNEITKSSRERFCPDNLEITTLNGAVLKASFPSKRVSETPKVNLIF